MTTWPTKLGLETDDSLPLSSKAEVLGTMVEKMSRSETTSVYCEYALQRV